MWVHMIEESLQTIICGFPLMKKRLLDDDNFSLGAARYYDNIWVSYDE